MNAAQIETLRKQKQHVVNKRHRDNPQCWCGLCHCRKCQTDRKGVPPVPEKERP